jgi:hypothetical protein
MTMLAVGVVGKNFEDWYFHENVVVERKREEKQHF